MEGLKVTIEWTAAAVCRQHERNERESGNSDTEGSYVHLTCLLLEHRVSRSLSRQSK